MSEPLHHPLDLNEAKRIIRSILEAGEVIFTGHAKEAMADDALDAIDCVNVLRGGWVASAEWENDSWRYRVCTARIFVVVEIESDDQLVVITVWRV